MRDLSSWNHFKVKIIFFNFQKGTNKCDNNDDERRRRRRKSMPI
jgi:hypothetical protein